MARRTTLVAAAAAASLSLLVACGGGSSGSGSGPVLPGPAPTATASPTPPGSSTQTIDTYAGASFGQTGDFTPTEGDTASGGQGQPVDGVTCDTTMSNNYHVHVYLGLFVNGAQVALPMGLGMENPGPPGSGYPSYPGFVDAATCFYHIHTHDQSGIVHIEDPDPSGVPMTGTLYTMKTFFDEWGITVNSNQFGPFTGPVRVFTSGQVSRGGSGSTTVPATDLTYWGSDATTVPAYSHEVIFVEVGPTWPTTLPNVDFYLEY
ncbi:MAG: hypothetical protein ACREMP_09235 [Candidatus Tyrphobacter sp.]